VPGKRNIAVRAEWAQPTTHGPRTFYPRSSRDALPDESQSVLQQSPVGDSQAQGPHLDWLARLLGYVSTGFLVACVNVSLVAILSGVRLNFPACRSRAGSPDVGTCPPLQVVPAIQFWTRRQVYPRGPPISAAVPNSNPVAGAH